MLRIKESGIGKKWCGDEVIILTDKLSQTKLKKLLKANCEFVEEYEKETTSEETETSSSTAKEEDTSDGSIDRRKSDDRKRARKPKTD